MAQLTPLDVPVRSAGDATTKVGPDLIKVTAAVKGIVTSNNELDTKVAGISTAITTAVTAAVNTASTADRNRANHTGTQDVSTITNLVKASVGLGNVDNTSDAAKPVSTAQAAAISTAVSNVSTTDRNRANHTGTQDVATITGLVKASVGLGSVDNTADSAKPVSTAQAAAITAASTTDRNRANHTGTQTAASISDFTEAVQDAVADFLTAGANITVNYNDNANTITVSAAGGTGGASGSTFDPEAIRDTIGAALIGLGNISVVVNDAADTITIMTTATQNSTDDQLRDRSTHTGTQNVSTITGLVKGSVGLGNVDNTSDALKPVSTAQASAISTAQTAASARANHTGTQDVSTITGLVKASVGLGSVDNTADSAKPVSTAQATAISTAQSAASARANHTGTQDVATITGLVKASVGLGSVDNTSDVNKPVSTAQATAISTAVSNASTTDRARANHTGTQDVSTITGLVKASVGLGNVDNTADTAKPVSTAQATAISTAQTAASARANHTGTQLAATISDFSTAAQAAVPAPDIYIDATLTGGATSASPLGVDTNAELTRVRQAISVASGSTGGSYNPATGVLTLSGGGGGTSYFGANGTHIYNTNTGNIGLGTGTSAVPTKKLQVVGGIMADTLSIIGNTQGETDMNVLRNIPGAGLQVGGGYILNYNNLYHQGNANIFTDGNLYIRTNGNRSYFYSPTGMMINGDTNSASSWLDINGTTGYTQLRLRTTYTPTGSADANGNVGDTAWDANYFYLKTAAGWKRTALTTW